MSERTKTLRDHLRVLRRHVWLIAATTVLAAIVAVALSATQPKMYTASATINFVDPLSYSGIVGGGGSQQPQATLAATGSSRLTQVQTLAQVQTLLSTSQSIDQLRNAIISKTDPSSFVVTVAAQARNASFAARLVNADVYVTKQEADAAASTLFAKVALNYESQLRGLSPSQRSNGLITSALYDNFARARALSRGGATAAQITSSAQPPGSPSSPKPVEDGIIGGFLGLIVGLLIAAVREAFDRRLAGPSEIESQLGLPLLAHVREESLGKMKNAGGVAEIEALDLEAFRILRTNLSFLNKDNPPRTVVVTSARPEEGKTTVASSLAFASAAAGRRTMLVECDLRRPQFANRLGIVASPGLGDYLIGAARPQEVVRTLPVAVRRNSPSAEARNGRLNGASPGGGGGAGRREHARVAGMHRRRDA